MRYECKYLGRRSQIFLDTGEHFFPSEPLPKDHLFEAGLNCSMRDYDLENLLLKPVNGWLNSLPRHVENEVITHLIKMGRLIRLGSASLTNEEPKHMDWTVDDEGYTETAVILSNMLVDLSENIGEFDGLLNSMERFICSEIGAGRMSERITEIPLLDKNIRFTEKQMYQLAAVSLFTKLMVPISNTYYSSFVVNVSPVVRPWIVISTPFMEVVECYCPRLIMLLRQHIQKCINGTIWANRSTIEIETEFQFCEYLWYILPIIDLYESDLKIIDSVLKCF